MIIMCCKNDNIKIMTEPASISLHRAYLLCCFLAFAATDSNIFEQRRPFLAIPIAICCLKFTGTIKLLGGWYQEAFVADGLQIC